MILMNYASNHLNGLKKRIQGVEFKKIVRYFSILCFWYRLADSDKIRVVSIAYNKKLKLLFQDSRLTQRSTFNPLACYESNK